MKLPFIIVEGIGIEDLKNVLSTIKEFNGNNVIIIRNELDLVYDAFFGNGVDIGSGVELAQDSEIPTILVGLEAECDHQKLKELWKGKLRNGKVDIQLEKIETSVSYCTFRDISRFVRSLANVSSLVKIAICEKEAKRMGINVTNLHSLKSDLIEFW